MHPQLSESTLRLLFLCLGMGTLFAYNAFLSCVDYFEAVNPDVNVSSQMVSCLLTTLLITTIMLLPISHGKQQSTDSSSSSFLSSPANRTTLGFALTVVLLLALILPKTSDPSITLLNILSSGLGLADALAQSGIYVMAASYGNPIYTAAVVIGSALSGLVVSMLRLVTRKIWESEVEGDDGLRNGAMALLWLVWLFNGALVFMSRWLKKDVEQMEETRRIDKEREVELGEVERNSQSMEYEYGSNAESPYQSRSRSPAKSQHQNVSLPSEHVSKDRLSWYTFYWTTFQQQRKPIISSFFNFFITLSLFPSTVASIPSSEGWITLGDWMPVVLVAVFNGGDFLGRIPLWFEQGKIYNMVMARRVVVERCTTTATQDQGSDKDKSGVETKERIKLNHYNSFIWYPTFARVVFYPLLILCRLPLEPHPIIHSDIFPVMIVFLLGISNGFIQCANFTVAPSLETCEKRRNATSLLLLLSIYLGLMLGAYFGLVVDAIVTSVEI